MKYGQKVMNSFDGKVYFFIGDSVGEKDKVILESIVSGGVYISAHRKCITPHFEFGDKVFYQKRLSVFLRFAQKKGKACIIEKGETEYVVVPLEDLEIREVY